MKKRHLDTIILVIAMLCFTIALIIYAEYYSNKNQVIDKPQKIDVTTSGEIPLEDGVVDEGFATEAMKKDKVTVYKSVLQIPKQDILVNIYDGVSEDKLTKGVCRYEETSDLGSVGMTVICGHRSSRWEYVFNVLPNMNLSDKFYIWDAQGNKHIYKVTDIFIVEPTDLWILDTTDTSCSRVRLFCCTNEGKQRLVVEGKEFDSKAEAEELRSKNYDKLLDLNSIISLPNPYLDIVNWYDSSKLFDSYNIENSYYTNFGVHLK